MKKFLSLIFFVFVGFSLPAKNIVRVVAIGPLTPVIDLNKQPQEIVDTMLNFWQKKIEEVLPYKPDLIVLPEACDRPAGMSSDWEKEKRYYEVRKDRFLNYFSSVAKDNNTYVVYSYKRKLQDGSFRNSSVLIGRDGSIVGIYDKNYPTMGEIDRGIVPGAEAPVFQCDFGTVGMLICFDLNFEELREVYAEKKPDILLFSSRYHGGVMQKFWAHSVKAFFVGAVEGIPFLSSAVYDPLGELLNQSNSHFLNFAFAEINLDSKLIHRDNNMEKMMALKKKYGDEVEIKDPGLLDVVLLLSYSDKVSVDEMIDEFGIETFQSYFDRSSKYRFEPGNMEK